MVRITVAVTVPTQLPPDARTEEAIAGTIESFLSPYYAPGEVVVRHLRTEVD